MHPLHSLFLTANFSFKKSGKPNCQQFEEKEMKRPRSACCSVLRNPRVSSLPVLGQGVTTYIPSATDRIGDLKEVV